MVYSEDLVVQLDQRIKKLTAELELYKTKDYKLADQIDPNVFVTEVLKLGWTKLPDNGTNAIILQIHKDNDLYQVNIPKGRHLGDFIFTIRYAAKELADFKDQEVKQVLVELVLATFDNKNIKEEKP